MCERQTTGQHSQHKTQKAGGRGYVYSVDNEIKINDQSFEGQSQRRCMLNERLMTLYTHIRYVVLKVVQIAYQLTNQKGDMPTKFWILSSSLERLKYYALM